MKKIAYIISDIDTALAFEWIAIALTPKFDLFFILIGKKNSDLSLFLSHHKILYYEIDDDHYSSWQKKWIAIFLLLRREKPESVHTHLWRANLLGLTSSWLLRIKQRIYTRHHATIHYYEYPSGRKWDRLCNALATDIIAISKNIEEILINWDKANTSKVQLIPHGFDFDYFFPGKNSFATDVSAKYNLTSTDYPVIGVISRFMEWKGIQFIIPAFKKLRSQFPEAKLILANAHGDYEKVIRDQLKELPMNSYIEIKFEKDLAALYRLFHVFVHVPVNPYVEAFGQTYIEALIVGVPSVFTLSGIAREFIRHKENAWVVDFKKSDQIEAAIVSLLGSKELQMTLTNNGKKSIQEFSLDRYIARLERLYLDL